MFTGLIEATGRIDTVAILEGADPALASRRLRIATPLGRELTPGDSIAVSGVCLTVTASDAAGFEAIVSPETLRVTTLRTAAAGRPCG